MVDVKPERKLHANKNDALFPLAHGNLLLSQSRSLCYSVSELGTQKMMVHYNLYIISRTVMCKKINHILYDIVQLLHIAICYCIL